jgi:hypothetical protein
MQSCLECSTPLNTTDIANGVCPHCHAKLPVSAPDELTTTDVHPTTSSALAPSTWLTNPDTNDLDTWSTIPLGKRLNRIREQTAHLRTAEPPGPTPLASISMVGLAVGLGLALLMILVCAFTFTAIALGGNSALPSTKVAARTTATSTTIATIDGLGFATQGLNPTSLPYTAATPTLEATSPPIATPTPTTTIGTPIGDNPARLVVAPQNYSGTCSLQAPDSFTLQISNSGGAALNWSIQAHTYKVSQENGALQPSQSITVTVSNIRNSGVITVIGSNEMVVQGSPQSISVQCQSIP